MNEKLSFYCNFHKNVTQQLFTHDLFPVRGYAFKLLNLNKVRGNNSMNASLITHMLTDAV